MKAGIHPTYEAAKITCACGRVTETRTTVGEIHVEICSHCHPFFTGRQKLVDTAGRVERFKAKYGSASSVPDEADEAPAEQAVEEPAAEAAAEEPVAEAAEEVVEETTEEAEAEETTEAEADDGAADEAPEEVAAEAEEASEDADESEEEAKDES